MSKEANVSKGSGSELSIDKAPGRTIGVVIMCALIVFVAAWMSRQSELITRQQTIESFPGTAVNDQTETGFRSDAWHLPDDDSFGFVEIAAGSFIMGSNPALDRMAYENERWSDSRRQGSVDLPVYYIGMFEVTVAQFSAFLQDSPVQAGALLPNQPGNNSGNNPVANITWAEALAYSRWLEQKLRNSELTPPEIKQFLESGAHVTLPSEAEWEKAARGTDGRVFPWGSQFQPGMANYESPSVVEVGSIDCGVCAHGLSDMSGNVWEFTRSPLQDYPYSLDDDMDNLSDDSLWVMRGGSYSDAINNLRSAVRGGVDPGVRSNTIGFRLAISTQ